MEKSKALTPPELSQICEEAKVAADRHGRIGFEHYTVEWHPKADLEFWKDGQSPLAITSVIEMPDFFFIGYVCSEEGCHWCDRAYPSGHHRLINKQGKDNSKKPVFIIHSRHK